MRTILLTFFLLYNLIAFAQSGFAPLNSFWNYYYTSHDGGYAENWTIKVTQDTIIGGAEIKALTQFYQASYSLPPYPPPYWQGSAPFGELIFRNDSVFYFFGSSESFLYSFNMNVNDSILILTFADTIVAVVDSLTTTLINGMNLKKWKLTKYCDSNFFGEATIIENIGPIDDFLLWNKDGCPPGGGWWGFMCYSSSNLNYNLPCNPLILGIEPNNQIETVFIFPNPAIDEFYINLKIKSSFIYFYLYNISGVLIKEIKEENSGQIDLTMDVKELPNGVYFIKIETENEIFTDKLIINK